MNLSLEELQNRLYVIESESEGILNEVIDDQSLINESIDNLNRLEKTSSLLSTEDISLESLVIVNKTLDVLYDSFGIRKQCNYQLESYKTFAIEDIKAFVKEFWVKIKSKVTEMWDKIDNFWANNFSSLAIILKSIEQTIQQVKLNYTIENTTATELKDSNISRSFNSNHVVDEKAIDAIISAHANSLEKLDELIRYTRYFNTHIKSLTDYDFSKDIGYLLSGIAKDFLRHPFGFGSEQSPIIQGNYYTITYEYDENNEEIIVTTNKESLDKDSDSLPIYLIGSQKLHRLLSKVQSIIKDTMKYKHVQENIEKDFKSVVDTYDKIILNEESSVANSHTKAIRTIYRINSSLPALFGLIVVANVKLARSLVNYSHFCLKEAK